MDFKVKMPNLSYIQTILGYTYIIILNSKIHKSYIYIMNKGLLYTYNSLYKHNMYLTNEEVVEDDEENK